MRVPMLDLQPQLEQLGPELKEAVGKVIDSTVYILGPEVQRFEEEVAEYLGVKHAIGVSSGTDALLVSLMALNVGPGDLVLTTTYSFYIVGDYEPTEFGFGDFTKGIRPSDHAMK